MDDPHQCTGTDWRPADEECQSSQPRDLWQKLRENQTVCLIFPLSHINSAWNYVQLLTLHLSPMKHQSPFVYGFSIFHPWLSFEQPSTHSLWSTCPTQMPSGLYQGSLRLRDGRPRQAKMHPSWNNPFDHSSLLNASSAPSWHLLLILSLLLWYPLWFPSLLHLHPMILPSLPAFLLTHYFLHIYDPRDHIIWERTSQKSGGEHAYQVEGRMDDDHYWITCWVDYTGVEFSTRVNWGLVIDPNPQDMLSRLDWVGSLMQLWWGHLSELI